jgi:hypothetical protein
MPDDNQNAPTPSAPAPEPVPPAVPDFDWNYERRGDEPDRHFETKESPRKER